MALQTRNLTHGTCTIKDGTGSPLSLLIPLMAGDLQFTCRDEAKFVDDRGSVGGNAHFSKGVEEPTSVQFTLKFVEYEGLSTSGADPSPLDALRKQGNAAAWVSTNACGPYVVDLEFSLANPCSSGSQAELLVFSDFHLDEWSFQEGEEFDTLVCIGKALILQPVATRS